MKTLLLLLAFAAQGEDELIRLLDHKDPSVRAHAAGILGSKKSETAVEALIKCVGNDKEKGVVHLAATEALGQITGQEFGQDRVKWMDWWDREGAQKYQGKFRSMSDVQRTVRPMIEELEKDVQSAKSDIRYVSVTVVVVAVIFLLVMIFFVGTLSSKLKEWKEIAKQTEHYLTEGREITRNTDKILEELEGKKIDIVGFIGKLREENQSELERYSDMLQQNIDHRMREEVMALRQKAEKELEQTLNDRRGVAEQQIRQFVSGQREKFEKLVADLEDRFMKNVAAHTLYLEASFHKATGRNEEALRLYKKMLATRPDNAVAWSEMATVLREMMRFDEAVETYQKALELSPDDSMTLYSLAAAYAQQHKRTEMLETLGRAIEKNGEFKDEALNNPAFKPYWNDAEFKDIAEV
ncbi:MAG: TPR end-of-group domain-containing protein [Planctomycetota bacterium]|jgi:uncharacterized protein YoxC